VSVGFDFPFGYPTGFAIALGAKDGPGWVAVWREIASKVLDVLDREDNSNNRFEVSHFPFKLRKYYDSQVPSSGIEAGQEFT
jgi:hypothetical protein